jgi:glycosyltransferase involved in cell wall biosynthesis
MWQGDDAGPAAGRKGDRGLPLEHAIWITWEKHRRTESIARAAGVRLFAFHSRAPRWRRHPEFLGRTLGTLLRERPRVLMVQNPSVVLTVLALVLRPFFRYRLVVDAHNAGVYHFERDQALTSWLLPTLHRRADLTIVTNEIVARIVRRNGGRVFILPDPLPDFGVTADASATGRRGRATDEADAFVVTFICSYAADEPYREVFRAARLLPPQIRIKVTGNTARLGPEDRALVGGNVVLTGFLPEAEFLSLLIDSDLVMDLTTFDDCLVCGAYEATALEVPMVLSDTPALRTHFRDGAVFVANTEREIADGILKARAGWADLRRGVGQTRTRLAAEWEEHRREFLALLSAW